VVDRRRSAGLTFLAPSATARRAPAALGGNAGDSDIVPLEFTAIDLETANSSSACAYAVGLARVRDGQIVATTDADFGT